MGPVLPPHSVDDTLGALFLGVVMAMALWGASTVQAYYYYNRYRDDAAWIKLMVGVVWIFDSAHQGMIIHAVYTYMITFYGHVEELNVLVKSIVYEVAMTGCITLIVQGFFIMRIWRLSNKRLELAAFLAVVCVVEFCLSVYYAARAVSLTTFDQLNVLKWTTDAINGVGAGLDLLIALSMIYLLHGSRTGFSKSDTIINKLIIFAMNTGTLTSLWAIAALICITVMPTTFWYIMFYFCTCKLYFNSLLATLNARKDIRGGHPDGSRQDTSISMNRFGGRDIEASVNVSKVRPAHALSIKVDTETRRDYPSDSKIPSSVDDPSSFLDTKGDAL